MKRFLILLLLLSGCFLYGENFQFKYKEGQKYRMITEVNQKVYWNDILSHKALLLNKIAFKILETKKGSGLMKGTFQVSEMVGDTLYKQREEEFLAEYWRGPRGKYTTAREQLMPLTRNIPLFPEKDIKIGESWKAMGEEVHDFRYFGISSPVHIPVEVNYTFDSLEKIGDKKIAKIKLKYQFNHQLKELLKIPGTHPVLVMGRVNQDFYWDLENGRVHHYEDSYDIIYGYSTHKIQEFIGTSRGKVVEVKEMDKKRLTEEIQKTIDTKGLKDTSVKLEDEGVTITFENIQFLPNSSILIPEEKQKLKIIASILNKHSERDILISGHTARFGTEESSQILSEERAKAVGEYLLSLGTRKANQLIYRGFGSRRPIGNNATEEGARKNRRVEITILEN